LDEAPNIVVDDEGHTTDLRALRDHIERMREQERKSIARELHDELGQLLTGIKLDFSAVLRRLHELKVPGDIVDRLQSAVGQIDIGIAMVRRISSDLRPALLDHHDLGGAIEYEARKLTAQAGIPIKVWNRVTETIEPERATAAFRIFQEAVTNAVRHSQATMITARLTMRGQDYLMLNVKDNGIGMSEEPGRGEQSLGLMGMRERARALGGDVRITIRPGHGTLVAMMLPVRSDVEES
jgi:signal transduction histidine kinase